MFTFSKTDKSLTIVVMVDGKSTILSTTSSNPQWSNILVALKAQDVNELVRLMSVKNLVESYTEASVEIKDGNVFYKGRALHGLDVDRLLEFARDGIPFLPLARFLERKAKNPSNRSVNEMYSFLEHREMTITPQGTIIGYKGVSDNYYSIMGNTATIMVSGTTDTGGHILNTVGSDIRCDRNCVCDDYKQGCSPGLHIGSLAYAKGWGPRVMIVEFDPADVVSVPDDCECQKLRACAYKVIGEVEVDKGAKTQAEVMGTVPNIVVNDDDDNDADYGDEDEEECQCPLCREDDGFDGDMECPVVSDDNGHDNDSESQETGIFSPDVTHKGSYSDGYNLGLREGRAHKARKHHLTDLDADLSNLERSYITGYNDGYRKGRYNKE